METNLEKFIEKADNRYATREGHKLDFSASRREIDEIKDDIDALELRINYIEKHLK
jgi:hypothetical protein